MQHTCIHAYMHTYRYEYKYKDVCKLLTLMSAYNQTHPTEKTWVTYIKLQKQKWCRLSRRAPRRFRLNRCKVEEEGRGRRAFACTSRSAHLGQRARYHSISVLHQVKRQGTQKEPNWS